MSLFNVYRPTAMYCADCESIDDYFFDVTHFWIFVPTVETFGKLANLCGSLQLKANQETSHCISCAVEQAQLHKFLMSLNGALETKELENTKVTTTESYQIPNLTEIGRMATLAVLFNRFQARWLIESVEQERYESWYQPIINAKTKHVYAHEGLFRIKDEDNNIVPPALAFKLAEASDLLFSLDLVARRSAVECAAKARLEGKLFINFNPSSIYDPSYCLRATASSIYEIGIRPEDVVFEVTETHRATDLNQLKGILSFYRSAGFKVALDDIGSGWSGLNLLQSLRPDYVKIDMELVRDVHKDEYKQNIVTNLIRIARTNDIAVIAEGIEVEEEAQWLTDAHADYLQGYLYGKPEPVKTDMSYKEKEKIEASLKPLDKAAKT
ncbi:EAL domain-containing protein [Alteromonas mediterranea]|uniref:EAL domain-containing protein n=1 Tax=Alteromonas mediterranea TaxID=314275 RepID=UPI001E5CC18F|nr:EAL domain-containing protein [Alteromonas mediterranea]